MRADMDRWRTPHDQAIVSLLLNQHFYPVFVFDDAEVPGQQISSGQIPYRIAATDLSERIPRRIRSFRSMLYRLTAARSHDGVRGEGAISLSLGRPSDRLKTHSPYLITSGQRPSSASRPEFRIPASARSVRILGPRMFHAP
jgi:hypothetical protein